MDSGNTYIDQKNVKSKNSWNKNSRNLWNYEKTKLMNNRNRKRRRIPAPRAGNLLSKTIDENL